MKNIIIIKFSTHPRFLKNSNDYQDSKERKELESQLLKAFYQDREIRIDVVSDKGSKTPTSYKCIPLNDNPKSLNDFDFKEIAI